MSSVLLSILWIVAFSGISAHAAALPQHEWALTQRADGINGVLELLRGQPAAKLELKSSDGKLVQSERLEKSSAVIETKDLGDGGKRLILVTQDFSSDFGSYNGPITRILGISSKGFAWIKAIDPASGKKIEVSLMRSLKTGWAYDPSVSGKGIDILKTSCRFDEDANGGFRTTYYRFHRGERGWVVTHRSEDTSWENESMDSATETSLPPTVKFPK